MKRAFVIFLEPTGTILAVSDSREFLDLGKCGHSK
jgi:hypothetical protein